jgi:nickel/cobalt exporter
MHPRPWQWLCALCVSVVPLAAAHAHPVPRSNHDRTIVVRLAPEAGADKVTITVVYRLEVDELTVVLEDMAPFKDEIDLEKYRDRREAYYAEFMRLYAPILANNLTATVDGKPLTFRCTVRNASLRDEQGQVLGHLRCDFTFQTAFAAAPGQARQFRLREGNYETQEGLIDLSVVNESLDMTSVVQPDAALKKRARFELQPGDEDRLREVALRVALPVSPAGRAAPIPHEGIAKAPATEEPRAGNPSLLYHFLGSEYTLPVLIAIFAFFGALHALTPGHGKTLVAAYLVGERGTAWHAIFLGLMTTLTHTGAVFAVGLVLLQCFPQGISERARRDLQTGLELAGGLLVFLLGAWLFLRRLTGRADHFHVGGHAHHHHDSHGRTKLDAQGAYAPRSDSFAPRSDSFAPRSDSFAPRSDSSIALSGGHKPPEHCTHHHADHFHDEHGHVHYVGAAGGPVRWWSLAILGISGGIVPCWDAIVILLVGLSADLLARALVLLVAFSAGLASVLIALGLLVVYARGFAASRWGQSRLMKSLPLVSAAVITALGFWLCYDSIHGHPPQLPMGSAAIAPRP